MAVRWVFCVNVKVICELFWSANIFCTFFSFIYYRRVTLKLVRIGSIIFCKHLIFQFYTFIKIVLAWPVTNNGTEPVAPSAPGGRPGSATNTHSCDNIRAVPTHLRSATHMYPHGLGQFYQKYTEAYGIPVLGRYSFCFIVIRNTTVWALEVTFPYIHCGKLDSGVINLWPMENAVTLSATYRNYISGYLL